MTVLRILALQLRMQVRDPWALVLALVTGSVFVVLYYGITGGGSTQYSVLVRNADQAVSVTQRDGNANLVEVGREIVESLASAQYASGDPMFKVTQTSDPGEARRKLEDREAIVLLELPEDLSQVVAVARLDPTASSLPQTQVSFVGDLTHPLYGVAAVLVGAKVESTLGASLGASSPIAIEEEAMGASGDRTEFESYVPGLLVISLLFVLFTAAITASRDVERGAIKRLRLTRVRAVDYIAALTLSQTAVAMASFGLSLGLASLLGFRSEGSLVLALLLACFVGLSVVGIGLIVAGLSSSVTRAFLVANLPLMLLMFFSGAIYPMPKIGVFSLHGRVVGLWDFLPSTHAVIGLGKILSLGAGFHDLHYEFACLAGLSGLFFYIGVAVFHTRHLRA